MKRTGIRHMRSDLLEVDVQNQFDWKTCEEKQSIFLRNTMIRLWFAGQVTKEERYRGMHTVRKALGTKSAQTQKRGGQGCRWRRAILRTRARFLALCERQRAPSNSFDCTLGNFGMVSKNLAATEGWKNEQSQKISKT